MNNNKLLPQSKALTKSQKKLDQFQLVPYSKIKISSKKIKEKVTKKQDKKETLLGNVIIIKRSVIKLEKLFQNKSKFLLDINKKKQANEKNIKRKEREEKLEEKKESKQKFPNIEMPTIPGVGIVDYIKNFLKWVIIGNAFMMFSKYIPNIISFVKKLKPLYDFFKTLSGAIFNGLVGFIEWTDKASNKLREITTSLGGEPFLKAFDGFSGALTTFMNLALIAGMTTMGGSDLGIGDRLDNISPDKSRPSSRKPNSPRITESGGRPAGKPNIRNPLRQRPQITNNNSGTGRPRVTTSGGRTARTPTNTSIRNAPTRNTTPRITGSAGRLAAGAGKIGAKTIIRSLRPLLAGMILGGLIDFGLSVALGENPGRAAFGAIGGTLLGLIGGALGGPFAAFTAIGGGMLGDWAGRKLYDVFFDNKKPSNTRPQRKNKGGFINPSKGTSLKSRRRPPNAGKTLRRPIKTSSKKVEPGKDIGGKKEVVKLFPDPDDLVTPNSNTGFDWLTWLRQGTKTTQSSNKNRVPNPFKALVKVSETFRKSPFGELLSAPIDAVLGQKTNKFVISNFFQNIAFMTQSLAQKSVNDSLNIIKNSVRAFAEGGEIPSRDLVSMRNKQEDYAKILEQLFGKSIEDKLNEAIGIIRKELHKKPTRKSGSEYENQDLDYELGNIKVSSDSSDFWLLVTAALFENGKPNDGYQGAADVAQAIYNRVSLPGWPKSIRGVILQPGQFTPVRAYGGINEWSKINSKESAIAFAKKYKGYRGNIVEQVAATLLDRTKQENARTFIGPRDNFRNYASEAANNHLDDSTEARRYGHVFGFEPGGANIGKFKKGKLQAAEINKEVIAGKVEKIDVPEATVTGGLRPSDIPLTSRQGWRWGKMHKGIDMDGGDGAPISSAQDAKVVFAGDTGGGYGNEVVLRYSNGAETRFAHLKSINVRTGQTIKSGQLIGRQGNTGTSTASHLHFEYYPRGGAMTYEGYGDAFSVKDSYFRYGGNVKAKISPQPLTPSSPPGQPPKPSSNVINATGMSGPQLSAAIRNIKPGQKIVFPGVGSVQGGKDWLGKSKTKYYDVQGKEISSAEFSKRYANSNLRKLIQQGTNTPAKPPGPVPAATLPGRLPEGVLKGLQDRGVLQQNMKDGGLVGGDKNIRKSSISDYPLYDEFGGESTLFILPVYMTVNSNSEKNRLTFPGTSGLNSNVSVNAQNLAR